MKILQIAPAWIDTPPKGYGGTELIIDMLANGYTKRGHDVTLFATGNSKTSATLKYAFDKCFTDMEIPWSSCLPCIYHYDQAFAMAEEFDLVHVHLSSDTDIMMLPYLAKLKKPHIMSIHGLLPYDKHTQMDKYYLDAYGKYMNAAYISQSCLSIWPECFKNYGVVHNAIDISQYNFNAMPQDYFTWIGKIMPIKGTHEAILAAKKAKVQFKFAGIVDKSLKRSYDYYNDIVEPLIDNEQIQYFGPADVKMKNELVGNAKGFLNPIAWDEPFGLVMTESMSCGTPVIAYNKGAVNEIITDGVDGYIVNNMDEMVERMQTVDKIDRARVRQTIESKFSIDKMLDEYFKIYERVIKDTK